MEKIVEGNIRFLDGARGKIELVLEMANAFIGRITAAACEADPNIPPRVVGKLVNLQAEEIYLHPNPNADFITESANNRDP